MKPYCVLIVISALISIVLYTVLFRSIGFFVFLAYIPNALLLLFLLKRVIKPMPFSVCLLLSFLPIFWIALYSVTYAFAHLAFTPLLTLIPPIGIIVILRSISVRLAILLAIVTLLVSGAGIIKGYEKQESPEGNYSFVK